MKNLQPLDLHPIKTESEYEAALLEIESLLEVPPGTPEAARLDLLAILTPNLRVHKFTYLQEQTS